MIDFSDLLLPQTVLAGVIAANKKALLHQLAAATAQAYRIDAKEVLAALVERERTGSTGYGGGIAIPHGRHPGIASPIGVFARLEQPVDFQSVDELPVDLVFMMLSRPDAGAEHLKTLARISRRLRDRGFLAKLRGAGSPDALFALWTGDEGRDAA